MQQRVTEAAAAAAAYEIRLRGLVLVVVIRTSRRNSRVVDPQRVWSRRDVILSALSVIEAVDYW